MHIDACSQRISDRVIISWFQTSLGVSVGHIFGVVRNDKEIKAKKDLQGQKDEAFRHARADRFKISFCMPPKFALSSEKNTSIVPARSSNFSNTLAWILTPVLDPSLHEKYDLEHVVHHAVPPSHIGAKHPIRS